VSVRRRIATALITLLFALVLSPLFRQIRELIASYLGLPPSPFPFPFPSPGSEVVAVL
jgi:hypothetical protein